MNQWPDGSILTGCSLIVRILIVILSLAGLANAVYFTLAYYGRVKRARWVPEVLCAREGSSCVTVVQTPYARVFGLPNSLLGIFYYVALIGWIVAGPLHQAPWVRWVLIAASVVTILLGFCLIYALRRILRIDCPLCYTAHAINAALMVLLLLLTQ